MMHDESDINLNGLYICTAISFFMLILKLSVIDTNVAKNVGWDERSESRHRPTAASGFAALIPTYEVAGSHR